MKKRLFSRFIFVVFSCIIISSLIADLKNNAQSESGSIVYEPEELEGLCQGEAEASISGMDGDDLAIAVATSEGSAISLGPIGQCNSGWYDFEVEAGIPEEVVWDEEIHDWVKLGYMDKNDAGEYFVDGFSDFCGACAISSDKKDELTAKADLDINCGAHALLEGQWVKILYDEDSDYESVP